MAVICKNNDILNYSKKKLNEVELHDYLDNYMKLLNHKKLKNSIKNILFYSKNFKIQEIYYENFNDNFYQNKDMKNKSFYF